MRHLSGVLFLCVATLCQAQPVPYFSTDGVAIRGYDPVSYFTTNSAVEGKEEFSYSWSGSEWHFTSASNLEAFKANPEKYAPQFGGYCAYGVSEDHKSPTEPQAFSVVNDKLYLNYSLKVRELWRKDTGGRIKKGEENWVKLKDTKE